MADLVVTGLRFLDGKLQQQLSPHFTNGGIGWDAKWVDIPCVTQAELDRVQLKKDRRARAYNMRFKLLRRINERESLKRMRKQYPPKP